MVENQYKNYIWNLLSKFQEIYFDMRMNVDWSHSCPDIIVKHLLLEPHSWEEFNYSGEQAQGPWVKVWMLIKSLLILSHCEYSWGSDGKPLEWDTVSVFAVYLISHITDYFLYYLCFAKP